MLADRCIDYGFYTALFSAMFFVGSFCIIRCIRWRLRQQQPYRLDPVLIHFFNRDFDAIVSCHRLVDRWKVIKLFDDQSADRVVFLGFQ